MGKNTQDRQSNSLGFTNEKTNQSFKWGRMLNALDYHRWHYVKKVLAHKKHHDERFARDIESDSKSLNCGNDQCHKKENTENSQVDERKIDPCNHTNNSPLPSSSKSSRATKIKKLIAKEISKRKSRHRRSSTCPSNSELEKVSHANHRVENKDKEVITHESEEANFSEHFFNEDNNSYDDHTTMKVELESQDEKQFDNHNNNQQSEKLISLQEIPMVNIKKLPLNGTVKRSASFHEECHMDVLDLNKEYASTHLNDHPNRSNKQGTNSSNVRKCFTKSCTFSVNDASVKNYLQQMMHENPSDSHDNEVKSRRFKDLRHKIKHLVKENRKERRRIAMDAVFHKVPYGHKVSEESAKECPNVVDIIEKDSFVTPRKIKINSKAHKRSPSLDECMDKYCQLFETTTSFIKDSKLNNQETSLLRVMDFNSSTSKEKGLGRIFSSPDLQVFLSNKHEDYYDGHNCSRTSNRRIFSFSGNKVEDDLNTVEESGNQLLITNEIPCEDLKENFDDVNKEALKSIYPDDEENIVISQDDFKSHTEDSMIEDFSDNIAIKYPQPISTNEDEAMFIKGAQSQELSNESPTISCVKVDEEGGQNSIYYVSPSLHHLQVPSYEREEFNYVKEILQLSGYLETQFLGTWYSSDQPIDPSIFVKIESCYLLESKCSPLKSSNQNYRLLLYDIVNEVLLAIYERSMSYWPMPLCSCSRTHPMPKGYHVLIEVWNYITWYMSCSRPELGSSLDCINNRELDKDDSWMNLQLNAECVGLEVEDLIFDDLLLEIIQ